MLPEALTGGWSIAVPLLGQDLGTVLASVGWRLDHQTLPRLFPFGVATLQERDHRTRSVRHAAAHRESQRHKGVGLQPPRLAGNWSEMERLLTWSLAYHSFLKRSLKNTSCLCAGDFHLCEQCFIKRAHDEDWNEAQLLSELLHRLARYRCQRLGQLSGRLQKCSSQYWS